MKNYHFKSGRYKDLPLSYVFTVNPRHIAVIYARQFDRRNSAQLKNELQLAIEDLKQKLKSLESLRTCPICKARKVSHFLIPDFGSIDVKLVSCSDKGCKDELKRRRQGELYLISEFLLLLPYINKVEGVSIIRIFKSTYGKDPFNVFGSH